MLTQLVAQPALPACYSPDRDGWLGPFTSIGCLPCSGPDSVLEWQARTATGSYASPVAQGDGGRFIGRPFGGLTEAASYCWRARFTAGDDAGAWGPSTMGCASPAEICFTFDSIAPSTPVLLDAGQPFGGTVEVTLGPGVDVGSGVAGHVISLNGQGSLEIGLLMGSVVRHPLGPATYRVQVSAADRADNTSAPSVAYTVTGVASTAVRVPAAPVWDRPVTNERYFAATWPNDAGARYWAVEQEEDGGTWKTGSRPVVVLPTAYVDVGGPCTWQRMRIAGWADGETSAWSAPSQPLRVDAVPPVVAAPVLSEVDGGVLVSWAPAIDSCPSGLSYELRRSLDGGAAVVLGPTMANTWFDVPPRAGRVTYVVDAIDGASNRGRSPPASLVLMQGGSDGGEDGGQDGGLDAGVVELDAGPPVDAGSDSSHRPDYRIGCGCSQGPPFGLVLFVAAALLRGRRLGARDRRDVATDGQRLAPF